ncbi:MAG: NUDIX hydrolase [Desulfocapsaceae bacterium]|nr:NUDIX hydrolase [Desulfocapsaceae bacterium]
MNYCNQCGGKVNWQIPDGEDRHRYVCEHCNIIHYQNPRMVAGAIPIMDGKILLCRRAIEPRRGMWTIPAGYLENGESVEQCARRETMEEALAHLDDMLPYSLLNITFIDQVYFIYRARLVNTDFRPGNESLEVQLFHPDEIPWDEIAFPVIRKALEFYYNDQLENRFPFREIDIPASEKL